MKILIVGGGRIEAPLDVTLENLGWVYSLGDVYSRSSALLRFTPRDGLSLMVLEALSFGRHVLWTKSFPFVKQVLNTDDICQRLEELLKAHGAGELHLQTDAAEFIRNKYDREKCIRAIASVWANAAGKRNVPQPTQDT
jgi:glycosyltransferase involved in cell wall biosynthesis